MSKHYSFVFISSAGRARTGTGNAAQQIFVPTTAFAANFHCLWSGLSLNHTISRLGHPRQVSTPS